MRHGGDNTFDISDAGDDGRSARVSLDQALDVACDVLRDYAGDPGTTRVERLAQFVVSVLGGEPYGPLATGSVARFPVGQRADVAAWRMGDAVGVGASSMTPHEGRQLAVGLIRACELAEES